jgi:hypothetical protein
MIARDKKKLICEESNMQWMLNERHLQIILIFEKGKIRKVIIKNHP